MNIKIGKHKVGADADVFIIAEAGVNHNGKMELALELIDIAAEAEVDVVKFQTFKADTLVLPGTDKAGYQSQNLGTSEDQHEMLKRLELTYDDFRELKSYSEQKGLTFLSTPFDITTSEFLNKLGLPAFKVSSGDLTNYPYLKKLASFGKPIILSTGMGTMKEVYGALAVIKDAGDPEVILLHCTTQYPTPYHEVNLKAMDTLSTKTGKMVGYSDHTEGIEVSLAAAARGAAVIEKHYTISRKLEGPDHAASLEPDELKAMVRSVRNISQSLGNGIKVPTKGEKEVAEVARKSVMAVVDISKGQIIEADMLGVMRPGTGISPTDFHHICGKRSVRKISGGSLIQKDDFE